MTAVLAPSRAVALLLSRKSALELMVAERFRQAREAGTVANVSQLSASLRQVKASLAAANGRPASTRDDTTERRNPCNPK
jgi:hypothetical protein